MGARLRVRDVSVRCGGGVYGAATRHAALVPAVGWRCRARRGSRLIQKPPNPTDLLHFSPPVLRRRPAHRLVFSLPPPCFSLCHLICICFSSPLLLFLVPSPVPKDLIFFFPSRGEIDCPREEKGGEGRRTDWWEEGDPDLFVEGRDGGAGAGAAGEDERHELAPHQQRALLQLRPQQQQGRRRRERRGDTARAGDRQRRVGLVGRGRGRARQAGPAAGAGAGAAARRGEEARPRGGGQGAEPAQAAAPEPRLRAAGAGAEEGVPDGAGGQGQGPRAPQCRARAAGLHAPEREQHAPPDTQEHHGARGQARRRRRRRQGGRRRQEAPLHQELIGFPAAVVGLC